MPFIITFISGISTILGVIPTYFNSKYKDKIINFSLAFACSVMLTVSVFSLIPEAIGYINVSFISIILLFIFINIGFIISNYIDKGMSKISSNSLFKLGVVNIIALVLHNIPEGVITFLTSSNDIRLGISIALAIALHNIPEGISIAVPIYYSTNSHKKAFIYTFIAGFSELIGGIISYIFLSQYINNFILFIILSITAGLMIHLSVFELLPNTKKNITTIIGLLLGFIIMISTIFIFKI